MSTKKTNTTYYSPEVTKTGWTEWLHPGSSTRNANVITPYRLACCDCSLVHDLAFKVVGSRRVVFKARRNDRATSALRRRRPKKLVDLLIAQWPKSDLYKRRFKKN